MEAGQKDQDLEDKLRKEWSGIFSNWIVPGAMEYAQGGLQIPQSITDASSDYRRQEDIVECFLQECCVRNTGLEVSSKAIWSAFETWCKETDCEPHSRTWFGRQLTMKGLDKRKSRVMKRAGVALKDC